MQRFFLVLLLLAACAQQPQLADTEAPQPHQAPQPIIVRPDIPRTPPPAETQPTHTAMNTNEPATWADFLNTNLFARPAEQGILVGDANNPFLFGMKMGSLMPVITRNELALLATPPPVAHGRVLRHENFVRFDFGEETSGELRFDRDPDTGAVRSELFFAEDAPLFEYAYLLYEGSFPLLLGQPLALFGHTYLLTDVSNQSLELKGIDTEHSLVLANGSALRVDGKRIPHTRVTVDPWSVIIRYTADDIDRGGIRLRAGESLREKLRRPEALLNEQFDIRYEGLEQNIENTIRLTAGDTIVHLRYYDRFGAEQELRIAGLRDGHVGFGDEAVLHTIECAAPCIKEGERFLILGPDGTSHLFEYTSLSEDLNLRDRTTGERHVIELEEGPVLLDGAARFAGRPYRVAVDPETRLLAVDANGDGIIGRTPSAILVHGGYEIQFPQQQPEDELLIDIVQPPFGEELTARIAERNGELLVGIAQGPILTRAEHSRFWAGATTRGLLVTLEDSGNGLLGEELTITYPPDFRAGLVRVTG
ncbi:hypothetical protein D6789_04435 [Candidatus Woesearchaeota archaeon]|nr:MAG: hypothetical protein D6789_04435 [Candidatus Woesearchaeota archaeon]